jgi:hypothetical protein
MKLIRTSAAVDLFALVVALFLRQAWGAAFCALGSDRGGHGHDGEEGEEFGEHDGGASKTKEKQRQSRQQAGPTCAKTARAQQNSELLGDLHFMRKHGDVGWGSAAVWKERARARGREGEGQRAELTKRSLEAGATQKSKSVFSHAMRVNKYFHARFTDFASSKFYESAPHPPMHAQDLVVQI